MSVSVVANKNGYVENTNPLDVGGDLLSLIASAKTKDVITSSSYEANGNFYAIIVLSTTSFQQLRGPMKLNGADLTDDVTLATVIGTLWPGVYMMDLTKVQIVSGGKIILLSS